MEAPHLRNAIRMTSVAVTSAAWALEPTVALAIGWQPDAIAETDSAAGKLTTSSMSDFVWNIVSKALGIAVAVFVLKVVMTAVDRIIFSGAAPGTFRLDEIPLIGAYTDPEKQEGNGPGVTNSASNWTWPNIWKHFAAQIALAAAASFIVMFLFWILSIVFGFMEGGATT